MKEPAARRVRLHRHGLAAVRRQHQDALLPDRDAAVVLEAHTADGAEEPRDTHLAIEVRVGERRAHEVERLTPQKARAVWGSSVAEVEARVAHEVVRRRDDAADRRRRAREGPWARDRRLLVDDDVADGDTMRDRLAGGEARAGHTEGEKEQLAHGFLVALAGDDLDEPSEQCEARVRVVPDLA